MGGRKGPATRVCRQRSAGVSKYNHRVNLVGWETMGREKSWCTLECPCCNRREQLFSTSRMLPSGMWVLCSEIFSIFGVFFLLRETLKLGFCVNSLDFYICQPVKAKLKISWGKCGQQAINL